MMELNFEEIFKNYIHSMKINRSYPYIPKDKKWALNFIIIHGIYSTGFILFVYNIIYHDMTQKDYSKACRNGILVIAFFLNTIHYGIMVWYQDLLVNLIQTMKKNYRSKTPSDIQIMNNYANRSSWLYRLWSIVTACGPFMFVLKNIIINIYYCMTDGCRIVYLYEITFPEPIEKYKNSAFVYIMANLHFTYLCIYAVTLYRSFIPLIPIFALHACGQLEIVKEKIDNLFKNSTIDEDLENLKDIVMHLQEIYSFVEDMKKCFKIAIEITLKSAPLMLPITYYELNESYHRGNVSFEFIVFFFGGIVILCSWCSYSDLLMEKGEDICLAVYSSGWKTSNERRMRATLILVMLRAQRPVALRTMFHNVCFEALTDIFQQSYAILNLMNAVWN